MSGYTKILVTLDGSELSERALAPATLLARTMGAELVLLRVVVPLYLWSPLMGIEPDLGVARERHQVEIERYLQEVKEQLLAEDATLQVDTVTLYGPVADAIVDYAEEAAVDLIVISSHGRSGLSRWVYGSVAEKVLQGAHCCSTLVVRTRKARSENDEIATGARLPAAP